MEVFTAVLGCVLLVVIFYMSTAKRRRYVSMIDKVPGPRKYPLIGSNIKILTSSREDIANVVKKYAEEYNHFYRMWTGPVAEIHISDPEMYEPLVSGMKHIEKGWIYSFLYPWLGQGLLTSNGSKWHSRRKIITPTFHFQILETFADVFVENSQILVKKLQQEMEVQGEKGFDICPFVTRCTLDIICETAMGVKVNAQEYTESEYMKAVHDISIITMSRAFNAMVHPDFLFYLTSSGRRYKQCLKTLHGFTKKVIQEKKSLALKNLSEKLKTTETEDSVLGVKKRMAFLDLLLKASLEGNSLTDQDIQEEVDTFMFEGHDTTTAAISWAFFLLGCYPDVQDKVVEELDGIFQGSDRPITSKDCQEMKYLERVIKETLRLYPSVPFFVRSLEGDTVIAGYTIPDRTLIVIHPYQAHRNPKYFPDPEKFDPDNFLPERVQGRHPYAYIPFSAGPRNCIGQKFAMLEQKMVLASVLRHLKLRSVNRKEDVKASVELVLRPMGGIKVVLTKR